MSNLDVEQKIEKNWKTNRRRRLGKRIDTLYVYALATCNLASQTAQLNYRMKE